MNLSELKEPFPCQSIHWRVGATKDGKGIALAYLDARDVMERLDLICGPENWQARYPFPGCCEIGIKTGGEWVWKANGAGETNVEEVKGQYSDAFKRAGVLWGIGQYLYDLPNKWVKLNGKQIDRSEIASLNKSYNDFIKTIIPAEQKKAVYDQTLICLIDGDEHGLKQVWAEFSNEEQVLLWPLFNSTQRNAIKELLK